MRLYHFTKTANLLPIKERGLLPSVDEGMSHHPVVWLTTEPYPNMRVTIDANRISVEPPENNLVRLTVEVPTTVGFPLCHLAGPAETTEMA